VANTTDDQIMLVAETTYGTPVAVTRAVPCLPDSTQEWDPTQYQGVGLYVGAPGGVYRSDRRGAGIGRGTLVEKFEAHSKGLGVALNAAFGTSTSTLVSGTTFQQVFTPTAANTVLPSTTDQFGVVQNDGTVRPHTYAGCTVDQFELDIPEGPDSIAVWAFTKDAKSLSTATALGTFSPASGPSLFGSWSTTDTITLGGTITVPTTTALATSSGSVTTALRSANLAINNNIDKDRWGVGTRAQPTVGVRDIKLTFRYEFNDVTIRDLQISQGKTQILIDLATTEALSTGTARLQIAVPAAYINTGALPDLTAGETVVSDVEAQCLWDGTNQPVYVVHRTADNAL